MSYGMLAVNGLKTGLPVTMCMAASGSARTILPDGNIGLCEHFSESNFVGNLESDAVDSEVMNRFQVWRGKQDECTD